MTGATTGDDGDAGLGFSLAGGGFVHRVFTRLGLTRGDSHDLQRQVIALVAFGWLPLMALATVEGLIGPPSMVVRDLSVHVRLLVGVPLLIVAAFVLDDRCRNALDSVAVTQPDAQRAALARILKIAARMRGSPWTEAVFLVAAIGVSISLWGSSGLVGVKQESGDLSATHAWYALVGLPLYQFFLLRTAWLWLLWTWICWALARLPLKVVATHPDLAGGLGYVARPIAGIALAFVAVSAVVASAWGVEITSGRARLHDFFPPVALLLVVNSVLALGPSMLFAGHLLRARVAGLRDYGVFAHGYVEGFHRRWILRTGKPHELLGTPDIQSLADLGHSFEVVEGMRVVPFSPKIVQALVVCTLGPMLPLLLTEMSVREVAGAIGKALI